MFGSLGSDKSVPTPSVSHERIKRTWEGWRNKDADEKKRPGVSSAPGRKEIHSPWFQRCVKWGAEEQSFKRRLSYLIHWRVQNWPSGSGICRHGKSKSWPLGTAGAGLGWLLGFQTSLTSVSAAINVLICPSVTVKLADNPAGAFLKQFIQVKFPFQMQGTS